MATTGTITLEKLQGGLELTRGTAIAATRKLYGERGNAWFEGVVTREFLAETMGSYVANYRHVDTEVGGKLTFPAYLTAHDASWWGQAVWGSNAATGPTNTSVYTWVFSPATLSVASDTLRTITLEAFSDTNSYQFPFGLVDKYEITWQAGQAAKFAADIVTQQFLSQGITGGLTDRSNINGMAGTQVKVFIDNSGGTMGSTQYNNVVSGKITWTNNWQPITHTIGNLYYDDAVRGPRSIEVELDLHFKDTQEYAHLLDGNERLVRVAFFGATIPSSSPTTTEEIDVDTWGFYKTAVFSVTRSLRMVKMTLESQYDTSATTDWKVTVKNDTNSVVGS